MRVLRRNGEFCVDRGCVRMHQVGPRGIPQPQRAATALAEMPAARTARPLAGLLVHQPGPIHRDVLLSLDLQRSIVAPEIDGVAAGSRGLATDRAVAPHERIAMGRFELEPHGAAVARAFEFHGRSCPYGPTRTSFWRSDQAWRMSTGRSRAANRIAPAASKPASDALATGDSLRGGAFARARRASQIPHRLATPAITATTDGRESSARNAAPRRVVASRRRRSDWTTFNSAAWMAARVGARFMAWAESRPPCPTTGVAWQRTGGRGSGSRSGR